MAAALVLLLPARVTDVMREASIDPKDAYKKTLLSIEF